MPVVLPHEHASSSHKGAVHPAGKSPKQKPGELHGFCVSISKSGCWTQRNKNYERSVKYKENSPACGSSRRLVEGRLHPGHLRIWHQACDQRGKTCQLGCQGS